MDISGSFIKEFDKDTNNVISIREVPVKQKDIYAYQKKRSAFNHMTVMFKKSKVIEAGNYENCPLMEDDMLWTKMLLIGVKCSNINDYLVYARTGIDMIKRRGGYEYFKKYKNARKKIYKLGYISNLDYIVSIVVQFFVCLIPSKFRIFVFCKLLRKVYRNEKSNN